MTTQALPALSRLLRRKLSERGWVAEDLAWRSQVRTSNIYRMARGEQDNPTWDTLQKLATGFGMGVLDFVAELNAEEERSSFFSPDGGVLAPVTDGSGGTIEKRKFGPSPLGDREESARNANRELVNA